MGSGGSPSLWPPGRRSPEVREAAVAALGQHCRFHASGSMRPGDAGSDWSLHMTDSDAAEAARIQADRAISTGKLHASPHFHTRPINVVVSHGSQGRTRFEAGFPLRCFQRLSFPYLATRLCRWRDNRSTRGTSTPVLSY